MSFISEQVRECLARKISRELGASAGGLAEDLIKPGNKFIEEKFERNKPTPPEFYKIFKDEGKLETLVMQEIIKKIVPCDLIDRVLKKTVRGLLGAVPYYIDPITMHEMNSYLQLVEEVMFELFSDRTTEEKEENIKKIIKEDKIVLQTVTRITGGPYTPEEKKLMKSKMLGLVQKAAQEELLRQVQGAKTLVLPLAKAEPEDVWSLAIALQAISA